MVQANPHNRVQWVQHGQNGSACFPVGAVVLFILIFNYRSDADPKYIGSALAGQDMMRVASGGAWARSMLAFLAIASLPIPIITLDE